MKARIASTAFAALAALASLVLPRAAVADCVFGKIADLPVTMNGLRPTVPAKINGKDAKFIVDSGAFFSTLGPDAPAKYGMDVGPAPAGMGAVKGAGGETRVMHSTTANDFIFGGLDFHRIEFLVNEKGFGVGSVGLLGQNVLHGADVKYDLGKGAMRLFGSKGCQDASLAYWAGSQPYSEIEAAPVDSDRNRVTVTNVYYARLNGYRIRVEFDSGAERSTLTLNAAAKIGVRPSDPGVVSTGAMSGVALRSYMHTWLAPFADFKIGDEEIKNFKLLIADTGTDAQGEDEVDLLIGEDFFLSHRILVANSQNKLYFTYSGGPVFNMKLPAQAAAAAQPADAATGDEPALDAEGYSRRAAAESVRRDFTDAVADLTQAIALSPNEPRYYLERGRADEHLIGNPAKPPPFPPIKDFDAALKLKADDVPVLLARSGLYILRRQPDLAKADLDAAATAAANDPDQRLNIAEAYDAEGFDKEALAEVSQWVDANPRDDRLGQALNARCWERGRLGQDLDKALIDCNAALKLSPGNPSYLDSRGLVRLRLGDYGGAIKDYDAAIQLMPSSPWSLYGRGLARLKMGMTAAGQADLNAAKALSPGIAADAAKRGLTP